MIEPLAALKVTVLGIEPAEGLIVKPTPPPPKMGTFVVNVPLPATETLPDAPQAIASVVGVTVKVGVVVTASPLSPCNVSTIAVSIVRPVESRTMKATLPQPLSAAVKKPPLVLTVVGVAVASAGNGEAIVYGGVPPKM